MPDVSVNLATHNRAAFLESCLTSLCEQTVDPARYEICVVANACTDNTPEIVARVAARYPHHRIFMVEEPVAGLSRARNAGIAATESPLLANIDDDATAAPGWLEAFLNRFAKLPGDVAMIGGEIAPVWQAPPPEWLTQWMKGILSAASNMGAEPRFIDAPEGLFEGNCCYRREAITSVGDYPVELGRVGSSLLSGEGAIHFFLKQKGWRLYFEPAALIRHTIHADRLTPMWFRKRYFWQGVSDYLTHHYHSRNGLDMVDAINIELPLAVEDWAFVSADTPDNLMQSIMHFESLGFVLALTGIMTIDKS
ncbi:MAG: glycosyltransferase family 2 protein [Alphaproteobacteria bacterium]|nr:glycosyltransferase family 2 protein [Alphaproteobacteria bacterium]